MFYLYVGVYNLDLAKYTSYHHHTIKYIIMSFSVIQS